MAGDDSSDCVDNNNGSGTDGNKVQMWACDGNTAAQNWTVNSNGTLTIDGGCMDITGAKYTDGTLIEWWPCNGGANQQWAAEGNSELVNPDLRHVPGRPRLQYHRGHAAHPVRLQRRDKPAVAPAVTGPLVL